MIPRSACAVLIMGWLGLSLGAAQEGARRPIDPGEIDVGLHLRFKGFLATPDGRRVAFATNKGRCWCDIPTGKVTEIAEKEFTMGAVPAGDFPFIDYSWSPVDANLMALNVDSQGRRELVLWSMDTPFDPEHIRVLLPFPRAGGFIQMPPVWSPDGKTIYCTSFQELYRNKAPAKGDNPPTESDNVTISLAGAYASQDEIHKYDILYHGATKLFPDAYADAFRMVILAIDVATGKVGLLARGNDIDRLYLSPDGSRLVAIQMKRQRTPVKEGVLGSTENNKSAFAQRYADIYMIAPVPVDQLPAIDLEQMEDRTIGWVDRKGARIVPVATNLEINRAWAFTPDSDDAKGTDCTPAIVWTADSSGFVYDTVGKYSTGDVYLFDCATGRTRDLTEDTPPLPVAPKQQGYFENQTMSWMSAKFGGIFSPLWLPGGKELVIRARGDVWAIPLEPGRRPRNLTEKLGQEVMYIVPARNQRDAAVDESGRLVIVTRDRMTRCDSIWKLDPAGGAVAKVADTGVCTNQRYYVDPYCRQLLYSGQSITSLTNIYRLDLTRAADEGNRPEYVTRCRIDLNDRIYPESRVLGWKTASGLPAYGILYLPAGTTPGHKAPMVLNAYPSQTVSQPDVRAYAGASFFNAALQGLLDDGIAYLYADIPMSPEGVCDEPMEQTADGARTAAAAAVATGLIDSGRMAVMGTSYGGYMVDAVLSSGNNPFKTGVSIAGIADLAGFYLGNSIHIENDVYKANLSQIQNWTSWTEYRQGRIGAPLWEAPERYADNSPIARWNKVDVPMLLIHGGDDTTVHPFFGEEAFNGLKYLDKNAVFAYYPRDTPAIGLDPEATLRIRGWLDEQLLGKPPVTQLADQGVTFLGSPEKAVKPPAGSAPPAGAPKP
jgi:dipeptidyl aminopeptidase/acylaminoacyl peptidase